MNSYSFPSGHALGSMVVYGTLVLLLTRGKAKRTDNTHTPTANASSILRCPAWFDLGQVGLLIFCIGASRVYLGAHYPTDVLGGWAVGLGLALLGIWLDALWTPRVT
jgi:undecaprenyl-diphosphatase